MSHQFPEQWLARDLTTFYGFHLTPLEKQKPCIYGVKGYLKLGKGVKGYSFSKRTVFFGYKAKFVNDCLERCMHFRVAWISLTTTGKRNSKVTRWNKKIWSLFCKIQFSVNSQLISFFRSEEDSHKFRRKVAFQIFHLNCHTSFVLEHQDTCLV